MTGRLNDWSTAHPGRAECSEGSGKPEPSRSTCEFELYVRT
jgi:hypothetical protein